MNDQSIRDVGDSGSSWNCAHDMLVIPMWMAVQFWMFERKADVTIGVVNCGFLGWDFDGREADFSLFTMDEQN